jgi:hypothetical protein
MKRILLLATIFTLSFLVTSNIKAQWAPTALGFGNANCFATIGMNLFTGTDTGVFLTTNLGASWTNVSNGLPFDLHLDNGYCPVRSLAVKGGILYAGLDDTDGIYMSTNNGISWTADTTGLTDKIVLALVVCDTNLVAGTNGGVYVSANGGSWVASNKGMTGGEVNCFGKSGGNLFAGTLNRGGVFRSTDNGVSWSTASTGLPSGTNGKALEMSGSNLFVGTDGSGVFRSSDNGNSWTDVSNGLGGLSIRALGVGDSNIPSQTLYVSTAALGYKTYFSSNNGSGWTDDNFTSCYAFVILDSNVFGGTSGVGVWKRSLSENTASVGEQSQNNSGELATYPNPFIQSTTITFTAPESGVADVSVVNLLGTEVAQIFSGELSAGEHTFTWNATGLPDGMYECIVRMNGSIQRVPMALAR